MKTFPRLPERGDFAFQMLVAPHRSSGAAMHDLRGFFGLHLSKTMPFGTLRDDEGHLYSMVRAVNSPTGTPNAIRFIYLSTRLDGETLRMDKAKMMATAQTLMPNRALLAETDTARWTSLPDEPGTPWQLDASGEHLHWVEEGLLDLRGRNIGPGMQWLLPGVNRAPSTCRSSTTCRANAMAGRSRASWRWSSPIWLRAARYMPRSA